MKEENIRRYYDFRLGAVLALARLTAIHVSFGTQFSQAIPGVPNCERKTKSSSWEHLHRALS